MAKEYEERTSYPGDHDFERCRAGLIRRIINSIRICDGAVGRSDEALPVSSSLEGGRTLPGVGVASSQRFRRGVASVPARPGVGVASQRLWPGVSPGVAPPRPGVAPNSSARPGVASHRLTDGVASVVSHSDVRAFLLHRSM